MCGLFGADTLKFGDKVYEKKAEFPSKQEAHGWAQQFRQEGYLVRVEPNPKHNCFDLYVCMGVLPPEAQQPQNPDRVQKY